MGEKTNKKCLVVHSILITVLVTLAYLILNDTTPMIVSKDWVGISLHALSENEAQLVVASSASWYII